jgi:hypothetical protein
MRKDWITMNAKEKGNHSSEGEEMMGVSSPFLSSMGLNIPEFHLGQ